MSTPAFDVAIVGAGLAGSALACALGDSDLQVALLEAQPLTPGLPPLVNDVAGFDVRVSAITPGSRQWLEQLGAWQTVAGARVSPYHHMTVWDAEGTGRIEFDRTEVNQPALGHIVENALLQAALLQRLATRRGVHSLAPVRVQSYEREGERIALHLADGRRLTTALLVGADGALSAVRAWSGIATREWAYDQEAIVATVACEQPHQATAWQIFRGQGPLALLPLQTGDGEQRFCSIVWSTAEAHAQTLMALDDDTFRAAVGAAFEHRLGAVSALGPRRSFPLRARHANQYTAPGVALVGDAAHTIHPLAGQGINLGFSDARALAAEVLRARTRGLSPAHPSVLARYQRVRKGENLALLAAMEGFKRLFGARAPAVALLRNRGLDLANASGPLKRTLMRQAMGIVP